MPSARCMVIRIHPQQPSSQPSSHPRFGLILCWTILGIDVYGKMPYSINMEKEITTARLEARLPMEVHALLKRAAEMEGRTLTDFVVTAARDAALRTIADTEVVRLSLEDQQRIAEAMLNPPLPTDSLRRAFQRRESLLAAPGGATR